MSYGLRQEQNLKQLQRLIMSPQMQQALQLMQLPVLELSTIIDQELEKNPVLEIIEEKPRKTEVEILQIQENIPEQELSFNDRDFEIMKKIDEEFRDSYLEGAGFTTRRTAQEEKDKTYQESTIQSEPTLFQHLMSQARDSFDTEESLQMAEWLIGNFDENGFIAAPLEEIAKSSGFKIEELQKIIEEIQTFEPFGVGASSLQESLLIQLKQLGKKETLSYKILEHHYDDLINNRIPLIKKGLKCTLEEIEETIERHITKLDLRPGTWFSRKPTQYITPDATIKQEDDELIVLINNDYMPSLRLNRRYMKMLEDESIKIEEKEYIKQKILSAKWLMKNLDQRNNTLERITFAISKKQKEFFLNPKGELIPLTMKTLAEELSLHESTIARAVANKYIDTPKGILPLRFFFTNTYTTDKGKDISSKTVKNSLHKLIEDEDKKHPLSDESLSQLLKEQGIVCARRTVAKYRLELNLGNAHQRKKFT